MNRSTGWIARALAGLAARSLGPGLVVLGTTTAPSAAHDWYTGLVSPTGQRCCSDRDCLPVAHRYHPETRRLEVRIEGIWWPVETATLVEVSSPDGVAHACFANHWLGRQLTPVIRCIILPGEV